MANKSRHCPRCSYSTNVSRNMEAHYKNTNHHKEARTTQYVQIGKFTKKVRR